MVGFGDAIRLGFARFLEFRGRSTRAEFWWWWLAFAIISTVLEGTPLAFLAGLVLIVPSLSLLVRRLHDTGRSGWVGWVVLIPAVGLFILAFFLAQRSDPGSNRYGPPSPHAAGGPMRAAGGGAGDAWRDRWNGGDPGPQGGSGGPPTPDGPQLDAGDGEDRPRASGWDDLPPPAPPGAR